jgi:hypothetical protein
MVHDFKKPCSASTPSPSPRNTMGPVIIRCIQHKEYLRLGAISQMWRPIGRLFGPAENVLEKKTYWKGLRPWRLSDALRPTLPPRRQVKENESGNFSREYQGRTQLPVKIRSLAHSVDNTLPVCLSTRIFFCSSDVGSMPNECKNNVNPIFINLVV